MLNILILSVVACAQSSGGGERDRTDDLLRAKQALSQLSYTPKSENKKHKPQYPRLL